MEIPVRGAELAYWDATRDTSALGRAKLELMVGSSSADTALKLRTTIDTGL